MTSLKKHTIAFYNIENLFEAESTFLQTSSLKWTHDRYQQKLTKLGFVIPKIGFKETKKHPAIIGLAELENTRVLEDLTKSKHLKQHPYSYVYFKSLDKRGMNIALLYDTSVFTLKTSKAYPIELPDSNGEADYTRDVLHVSGILEGEMLHILVNHWPSKRENDTEIKRMVAARTVGEVIQSIKAKDPEAKLLIMGDFNDDCDSPSLTHITEEYQLYNPMEILRSFSRGSLNHNRQWYLFDQIFLSANFLKETPNQWQFDTADIFDASFLKYSKGKHRGRPFRSFIGGNYHGGYSDHFPVYVTVVMQRLAEKM